MSQGPAATRRSSIAAVIPARYGSTRLPGKPLIEIAGRPLVEHVWRRVRRASGIDRVLVATDDERIARVVRGFGGDAVMTRADHATGSDRIGEVLGSLDAEVIVNVQGDEPEIDPDLLDRLVEAVLRDPDVAVATAAAPFPPDRDPRDPSAVKVVCDRTGRALYFSRALIPHARSEGVEPRLHVGVYAYRRAALERFLTLPRGDLERAESLEQLRLLENGLAIAVLPVAHAAPGIDTPEDLEAFRRRIAADAGAAPLPPGADGPSGRLRATIPPVESGEPEAAS